jgi:hypothetical protein
VNESGSILVAVKAFLSNCYYYYNYYYYYYYYYLDKEKLVYLIKGDVGKGYSILLFN